MGRSPEWDFFCTGKAIGLGGNNSSGGVKLGAGLQEG